MIKKLIFVYAILFSLNFHAQVNFEKGYFIDNNNVKTECFIRNQDWKNNPVKFDYKASENESSINEKGINEVKEFGIGEFDKFERFEGLVDDSSNNINELSAKKDPLWIKRTIFLKVIIQGNATLYSHFEGNSRRFFYSYNGSPIEQLVYKKYAEDNVSVKANNLFQRQLFTKVKCESTTMNRVMKMEYAEKDLSAYFLEVNNCGVDPKDLVEKRVNEKGVVDRRNKSAKDKFLFRVKGGVDFNSLEINYIEPYKSNSDFKFDGGQTYKFGFDIEYVLPTNKNKWSVFFELAYQSKYKSNKKVFVGNYPFTYEKNWNISYQCYELGLGIRHYMFLNNNSKLFVNVSLMLNPISEAMFGNEKQTLEIKSKPHIGLGLGYAYKRYSMECRYSNRNILEDYYEINSKYKDISVVLGYTLFESNKKK